MFNLFTTRIEIYLIQASQLSQALSNSSKSIHRQKIPAIQAIQVKKNHLNVLCYLIVISMFAIVYFQIVIFVFLNFPIIILNLLYYFSWLSKLPRLEPAILSWILNTYIYYLSNILFRYWRPWYCYWRPIWGRNELCR